MLGCFFFNLTHYVHDSSLTYLNNCKVRSKMAQNVKRMHHVSRLDTIMEATQKEESDSGDCFHVELSQKLSNGRDSVDVKNIQDLETSRRTGIVISSTRICRSSQKRHERSTTLRHVPSAECLFRFKQDQSSKMTQNDNKNARDLRQVQMLFPEFFPSGASSSFIHPRNWHETYHQNDTTLLKEKVKEDPFIRPWLNLFGPCSYT